MTLYPINITTQFTVFQGVRMPDEYAAAAKTMGAAAVGVADEGLLVGAPLLYWAANRANLPAVLGCRFKLGAGGEVLALACHENGYARLVGLVNRRPGENLRLDDFQHAGDQLALVLTSLPDPTPTAVDHQVRALKKYVPHYRLFIGLDTATITRAPWLPKAMREQTGAEVLHLERIWGITPDDRRTAELLNHIERKKNAPRPVFADGLCLDEFPAAVERAYAAAPETVALWEGLVRECRFSFTCLGDIFPRFDVPGDKTTFFRDLVQQGLRARLAAKPNPRLDIRPYTERLRRELEIILNFNYTDYFLIVADIVAYAGRCGVAVGPGRGSAVGSLTAYALGITDIDPIEHRLAFETFLNQERIKLPDIDLDFCRRHRTLLLDYVREKYGGQDVMRISTILRYQSRMALRKAAEACRIPLEVAQRRFPEVWRDGVPLPPQKSGREPEDPLLDAAHRLVGRICGYGVHPSGLVIVGHKGFLPVAPTRDAAVPDRTTMELAVTQFPHEILAGLRMVKFDLLSLNHLTILGEAERHIQNRRRDFRRADLHGDDWLTFAALRRGETRAVFQLEGEGMTRLLQELKPHNLQSLMAGIAMYRPGPLAARAAALNAEPPPRVRNFLAPFLAETHGALLYKEQIMHIYAALTGESLERGLLYLEAMRESNPDKLAPFQHALNQAVAARGWTENESNALQVFLSRFGQYVFNRCFTGDTQVRDAASGEYVTIAQLAAEPCPGARRLVWTVTPNGWDVTPIANVAFAGRKNVIPWRRLGADAPGAVSVDHRIWTGAGWRTAVNAARATARRRARPQHQTNPGNEHECGTAA